MNIRVVLSSVSKTFSRGAGVTNVSCEAGSGEVVGIAGRNGAGKSTLVRMIAGVLTPASGTVDIRIDGKNIDADAIQNFVGLVAPYLALYDEFTPLELLEVTARLRGLAWTAEDTIRLLTRIDLASVAERTARGFSSGMMQRLRFAVALQHQPPILLLDEPTSNLDEAGVTMVKSIVDDQRASGMVFLASNNPAELSWCTSIVNVETHAA